MVEGRARRQLGCAHAIRSGRRTAMKAALCLIVFSFAAAAQTQPSFEQRRLSIIDAYAHYKGPGDAGYAEIAARLWKHEEPDWCSRKLEQLLAAGPTGD